MSELLQWFKLNWTVNVSDRIEIGPDRELDWSKGVVIGKMFLIGRNAKQIVTALRKVFGQRPSPKTSKHWESTARPISTAQIQISAFSRAKAQLPNIFQENFTEPIVNDSFFSESKVLDLSAILTLWTFLEGVKVFLLEAADS